MSLPDSLKGAGLRVAMDATQDVSDPDERMLRSALNDYLFSAFPLWSIELRSQDPFQLEVVGSHPGFGAHLAGTAMSTPRDRARTAVVRAFATIVSRMSVRSLKFDPAQRDRLRDPAYLQTVFSLRVVAIRQVLVRRIEKHGYAGLLRVDVLPMQEQPKS